MSYHDWLQKNRKPTWQDARLKVAKEEGFVLVQRERYNVLAVKYAIVQKHSITLSPRDLADFLGCHFGEAQALLNNTLRPTDFPCGSVENTLDTMIAEWETKRDQWLADIYLFDPLAITTKKALEGWTKLLDGLNHGGNDYQRWKAAQYAGRWIDAILDPQPDEDENKDD